MLLAFAIILPSEGTAQAIKLPVMPLTIDAHTLRAEVAATESARNFGLMYRKYLARDHGMLFVFDTPGRPCFWMKNTPLPLTIAFIDRDGVISDLIDMAPHDLSSHCPSRPVLFALEMEQGWFEAKGIQAGQRVSGLPRPER